MFRLLGFATFISISCQINVIPMFCYIKDVEWSQKRVSCFRACLVIRAPNTRKKLIRIKYSSPISKLLDISKQIDLKVLRSRYNNLTSSLRSRQFSFHFQAGRLSEQPSPATYLLAFIRSPSQFFSHRVLLKMDACHSQPISRAISWAVDDLAKFIVLFSLSLLHREAI